MSSNDAKTIENEPDEEPFGLGCALEMFVEAKEVLEKIDNLKTIHTDRSASERAFEHFNFIISQYKEQPHLLDSHLDELLEKSITIIRNEDSSMDLKHSVFKYLSVIVNVRGYKVIVRHLPHEVADFESVLRLLEAQNHEDAENWTTRYVLLLWLSIIVMIPFHLCRFDQYDEKNIVTGQTIMSRVLHVIKTYTILPDKCMDAAAYLSARFITRNDVKEEHLNSYLNWCMSLSISKESNVFVKRGTLSSIAMILKHGKRDDLLPFARELLQWIVNEDIKQNGGTNVQKLVYKIVQRIGLIFLPPRVASWRYNRGNRSLSDNLSGGDGMSSSQSVQSDATDGEENIDVPDEVEEIIDQLIHGLRSGDGIVRWSAAKGIGRVTGRLPKDLADQVVGSVLELFSPRESDGAWHGGCLALAELGRRGLLLPTRLPEVVPVVLKALVYDEPRGYSSVGSHIRDAACYVCWSFARAYETSILQPFVNEIASTLLIVTCYDREINCRRAASAAFQENVGRQGTFPHGIEILTVADFFAVSVRNNSYLTISVYIAQFEEYTIPLIEHLLKRKVDHWDSAIRELTVKTLHNLTPKAVDYVTSSVLPKLFEQINSIDLNSRHGSVMAIGEILYAISKIAKENDSQIEKYIDESIISKTGLLVSTFRERLYFRGLGGELMRQACCDFIQNCSLAAIHYDKENVVDEWLSLIDDCISYNVPTIQMSGVKALPVLLERYFSSSRMIPRCDEIVTKYIQELLLASQQETRMGHALALGSLPKFILELNLDRIIDALVECTKYTAATAKWAESRRDALKALTSITVTMSDEIGKQLNEANISKIMSVLLEGLKDYTQDKRGDVGAWVREASISGLQIIVLNEIQTHPEFLTQELIIKIVAGIAQQAVEKIDRTRALAGKVFYGFLYNSIRIPNYDEIIKIFPKEECDNLNWNSAAVTFPKFVELLQFPAYTHNVMLGIVCSVGGLTETLVKNSCSSLFAYLKNAEKTGGITEINRLCEIVYGIFEENQKDDRIAVPMFRFLDKLLSSGSIHLITEDPNADFPKKILKLVLGAISGCRDVYKLIDGVNVLAQFIQIHNEVCQSALVQLSILLCHRQTYVRKSTATTLYESLLIYGDAANFNTANLDEVMELLSNTNWEEAVDVVKPTRNQLCILMGIRVPVPRTPK